MCKHLQLYAYMCTSLYAVIKKYGNTVENTDVVKYVSINLKF